MEKKELDIFLAEKVMGWTLNYNNWSGVPVAYFSEDNVYIMSFNKWHPTESHDQAYLCEEMIPEDKRDLYLDTLTEDIFEATEMSDKFHIEMRFNMLHATPEQKCRAIYKALTGE